MAALPAAIIDTNRRRAAGVQVWEERIEADEIGVVDDMRVTTPARTALDLARRYPTDVAVAAIDALAQAVEVKLADIELLGLSRRRKPGCACPPPACGGHRSSRAQYVKDIRRLEMAERMGWVVGPGDSKKAQKTAPRTLSAVCAKHERAERNASAKTAISQWGFPRKRVVPPAGAARQNVRPAAGD